MFSKISEKFSINSEVLEKLEKFSINSEVLEKLVIFSKTQFHKRFRNCTISKLSPKVEVISFLYKRENTEYPTVSTNGAFSCVLENLSNCDFEIRTVFCIS